MRRIVMLLSVVAVMVAVMLVMAAPAFADRGGVRSGCSTGPSVNPASRLCGNPNEGSLGASGAPPAASCNSPKAFDLSNVCRGGR
jgi:hypothetical protein